jgi:hypothetical protein
LIKLFANSVRYYSELDENGFFIWLQKIDAVRNVIGEGQVIIIECDPPPISDDSLRDLLALFYRYGIETQQLDVYLTEANRSWFADENAYWKNRKRT